MLPDYPKIKEKLNLKYIQRFREIQKKVTYPLSKAQKLQYHEGEPEDSMKITSEIEINLKEIKDTDINALTDMIDKVAVDFSMKQSKAMYERLIKDLEAEGRVLNFEHQKPSKDLILKMIESVDLEFDEYQNPILPEFVGGGSAFKAMIEVFKQTKDDPEFNKLFEQIIEKKRVEWRDRESNRKLVG